MGKSLQPHSGSSPPHFPLPQATRNYLRTSTILTLALIGVSAVAFFHSAPALSWDAAPPFKFYANITRPHNICVGVRGDASSYSGYIGLEGDNPESHRRSFFWYFEAEEDPTNAPIILTFGGGPGTSGMLKPLGSLGPCILSPNGTVPNPDRITERFNMLALDHPIGTGFSYGRVVNNSYDAALDVYDFLQKFFALFPHLSKNQLIITGGSYGGKFIPNVATVIQERNEALAHQNTGVVRINLESLMISNPFSDPVSYYRWLLYFYCELHSVYDKDTCAAMYAKLPDCLDLIELSLQATGFSESANAARRAAHTACSDIAWGGDTHGTVVEDVRRTCHEENSLDCFPRFKWIEQYFRDPAVKRALGVPPSFNYTALSTSVSAAFSATADIMLPAHLMYEPLLAKGIRVLHYIGAQDGNCAWPGVLSFLKLLRTPFQRDFNGAPDVPWPTPDSDTVTVRAIGDGAGNMTYILIKEAGHFPSQDQPALVKDITEHWIYNVSWFQPVTEVSR